MKRPDAAGAAVSCSGAADAQSSVIAGLLTARCRSRVFEERVSGSVVRDGDEQCACFTALSCDKGEKQRIVGLNAHRERPRTAARASGRFTDEIAPVTIKGRKGDTIVEDDEYIRAGATIEAMMKLKPAFKKDGTVTAANASGLNDGAAALVLMSAEEAAGRGSKILATVKSWASVGVDPSMMGIGPVPAVKKALEKAGWTIDDLDLIEANEAFAAQALSVCQELGLPAEKVNVNGGAIAIGHPIGASGARVLTTLLYEMKKRDAKKGLATLCIGGGMLRHPLISEMT